MLFPRFLTNLRNEIIENTMKNGELALVEKILCLP
jgi:hypothetical protein